MRSTRVPRIYQLITTGDLEIAKDRRCTLILLSSLRDVVARPAIRAGGGLDTDRATIRENPPGSEELFRPDSSQIAIKNRNLALSH
jgi:hypothetical protein